MKTTKYKTIKDENTKNILKIVKEITMKRKM
jgi:hypothetical protein